MTRTYGAAEFKAKCLRIITEVAEKGNSVEVTKRGRSLVRVIPVETAEPEPPYGYLAGTAMWTDDLLSTGEQWEADGD